MCVRKPGSWLYQYVAAIAFAHERGMPYSRIVHPALLLEGHYVTGLAHLLDHLPLDAAAAHCFSGVVEVMCAGDNMPLGNILYTVRSSLVFASWCVCFCFGVMPQPCGLILSGHCLAVTASPRKFCWQATRAEAIEASRRMCGWPRVVSDVMIILCPCAHSVCRVVDLALIIVVCVTLSFFTLCFLICVSVCLTSSLSLFLSLPLPLPPRAFIAAIHHLYADLFLFPINELHSEYGQLIEIFKLLGTPTEASYPSLARQAPHYCVSKFFSFVTSFEYVSDLQRCK
jgi:hypothetical protein